MIAYQVYQNHKLQHGYIFIGPAPKVKGYTFLKIGTYGGQAVNKAFCTAYAWAFLAAKAESKAQYHLMNLQFHQAERYQNITAYCLRRAK